MNMNTKEKFDRRMKIVASILLAALWLPVTALAQELDVRTETRVPGRVGFGEMDPAALQLRESRASRNSSDGQLQRDFAGFAETDPSLNNSRIGIEANSLLAVVCMPEPIGLK
jgi:hypothetical protein